MSCDTSHGWVKPRPDGARARCGGPHICTTCQTEQMHESMLNGLFGGACEGRGTTPQSPISAKPEPYGSPADIAGRIEIWMAKYGRQDAASLLLYEAMKALRTIASKAPAGDASC